MTVPAPLSILLASILFFLAAACSFEAPPASKQVTPSQGTWSRKAPMPIEISEVTVAAAGNKIYAIGGSTADRVDHQLNHDTTSPPTAGAREHRYRVA